MWFYVEAKNADPRPEFTCSASSALPNGTLETLCTTQEPGKNPDLLEEKCKEFAGNRRDEFTDRADAISKSVDSLPEGDKAAAEKLLNDLENFAKDLDGAWAVRCVTQAPTSP